MSLRMSKPALVAPTAKTAGSFSKPDVLNFILPAANAPRGFTLIEILVAVFIFGLVVTTILFSHHTLEDSRRAIAENLTAYETAKIGLDRMVNDLRNLHIARWPAYRPPDSTDRPDPFKIEGNREYCRDMPFSRLGFASLCHLPVGSKKTSGIARITYYPAEEENGLCVLKRSDRPYLTENHEELRNDPVLCYRIKKLAITYIDADGKRHENWDSDSDNFDFLTPRAIEILMAVGDENGSRTFKTMVDLPVFRSETGKG